MSCGQPATVYVESEVCLALCARCAENIKNVKEIWALITQIEKKG